jgi:hypothetical protein
MLNFDETNEVSVYINAGIREILMSRLATLHTGADKSAFLLAVSMEWYMDIAVCVCHA